MKNRLMKFIKEEDGATIVEYVIMLALIAGIVLFAFPSLRGAIVNWISGAFEKVDGGITNGANEFSCHDGRTVADLSAC